jgi:hypothetical protein
MKTMFTTTRHNEKSHGDFAFHPLGNPSFERSVPKPEISTKTTTEMMLLGSLWTVAIKSIVPAYRAVDEAALMVLGAVKIRALEPGEDD